MNNTTRLNGFDALRSVAMWLGVLLHALIAYKLVPEFGWPTDPSSRSEFYNWLYNFIHSFRMPLFFMVSGFFTRLVIEKKGILFFAKQRGQRIVIPFVVGVLIIVPLTMVPFHYYGFRVGDGLPAELALRKSIIGIFDWNGLAHLWFLYYLIIYYCATYLVIKLLHFTNATPPGFVTRHRMPFVGIALITVSLILFLSWFNGSTIPPVYTGLKIQPFNVCYYALFYLLGWALNRRIDLLADLSDNGIVMSSIGLAISVVISIFKFPEMGITLVHLFSAIETVLLVLGITGIFLKVFNRETRFWRYCSDASYWMYLVHLVIIVWLQVLFINSTLSPILRLMLVLISTLSITLITYHFFVRKTVIGIFLNGKRRG